MYSKVLSRHQGAASCGNGWACDGTAGESYQSMTSHVVHQDDSCCCWHQELTDKLDGMEADLKTNTAKSTTLEEEVKLCSLKLGRAEKLIGGLGDEKARWTAAADQLQVSWHILPGIAEDLSAHWPYINTQLAMSHVSTTGRGFFLMTDSAIIVMACALLVS